MLRFLSIILVLVLLLSCEAEQKRNSFAEQIEQLGTDWLKLLPPSDTLRVGDIVTRLGKDMVSDAFRNFSSENKDFSHGGILGLDEDSNWIVYHAIGTPDNPEGILRKEKLASFCNPIENKEMGIYRYTDTTIDIKKIIVYAELMHQKRVGFDFDFNFNTDDELYCSEFIYKAFKYANPELDLMKIDENEGKKYLPLDRVYYNSNCILVYKTRYSRLSKK